MIDYIVEGERPFAGSRPFNEARVREIAARVFDRTTNLASSITNHAGIETGERWRERLGEVRALTLVIHGTEDPMFPYANAVALAKEIPGAQLLALEGVLATRCPLGISGTLSCPLLYCGTRRLHPEQTTPPTRDTCELLLYGVLRSSHAGSCTAPVRTLRSVPDGPVRSRSR